MPSTIRLGLPVVVAMLASTAFGQDAGITVANGEHVSIVTGCHDCHTVGYTESDGNIDPAAALKGSVVGFNGPWGTTYPANLRIIAAEQSEDEWVKYLQTFKAAPPMPWFNVHRLSENDMRSLHRYIVSLGAPGDPAPKKLDPGVTPKTPYIVFAPVMPK